MHTMNERKINFGAGPAQLPSNVLEQFAKDLINYDGSGVGVGELSHRTAEFEKGILERANENLMALAGFKGDEWRVLWMTGGGTGQFAAVPMNFSGGEGVAMYLVTGTWSEKAAEEAKKVLGAERVDVIDLRCEVGKTGQRSLNSDFNLTETLSKYDQPVLYVYYCDNETVDGIEIPDPEYFQLPLELRIPLIVDMSSNFLSRRMPSGASLIFAGVQKNLGAAGVTVVLIKSDLLKESRAAPWCPSIMDYRLTAKNNSLLNTPPVLAIHLCNLVLKDLRGRFRNLDELDAFSRQKSLMLYEAIDRSDKFYCPIAEMYRSRMNVVFKSKNNCEEDEAFLREAEANGMIQLKGHRSVGGLRASLYNAIGLKECEELCRVITKG